MNEHNYNTAEKKDALVKFLREQYGWDVKDAKYIGRGRIDVYDGDSPNGEVFFVGTDFEADEECRKQIREDLWAFNPEFLVNYIHAYEEMDTRRGREAFVKHLGEMLGDLCEDANEVVFALIGGNEGYAELAEDAMEADGRAHFLADYDGEEIDIGGGFYAFRQ